MVYGMDDQLEDYPVKMTFKNFTLPSAMTFEIAMAISLQHIAMISGQAQTDTLHSLARKTKAISLLKDNVCRTNLESIDENIYAVLLLDTLEVGPSLICAESCLLRY